ncbi:hypothetical protein [Curtobacterium oceanosedimentum]|uniref:Uncharacterized protein n=1 Tax=Curtobacterium oceanosedimentum TaxID=465820 RepID=A0A147DM44_9MICO|nr:hypothetical protein [Curtobacterium oceanosedimentum]KTR47262.1 hypothetical protein NS359_15330 [Curtobacterium oceanosedimentum]
METQPGARTPLVDPFGRELEEWLRDVPATRTPYLADLVVPPVTGPVQRPVTTDAVPTQESAHTAGTAATDTRVVQQADVEETTAERPSVDAPTAEGPTADAPTAALPTVDAPTAFRRRDRARHVAACAPSFPEPPARIALRIEDLAVEVSATSGRSTIERIVLLEDEVARRDEDLARLAAWEATVAHLDDAEVEAARAFARAVFADLLADAADEAARRERAAARRAATAPVPTPVRAAVAPSTTAPRADVPTPSRPVQRATTPSTAEPVQVVPPTSTDSTDSAVATGAAATTPEREAPVRPALGLPVGSPLSAATRPTPLVQPATGPTVIDRAAFAAALTAHEGVTAATPVVLPDAVSLPASASATDRDDHGTASTTAGADSGWWARLVARLRSLFGRR